MPHTSRKKRTTAPIQKRLQVTDDDGWTHVTSTNNVRRVLRGTTRAHDIEQDSHIQTPSQIQIQDSRSATAINAPETAEPRLGPAEAPGRLTLEELQMQYRGHREKWITSETWTRLKGQLGERIAERLDISESEGGAGSAQDDNRNNDPDSTVKCKPVDAIVCIGLGSPSGFLRGGWVDRRSVSMYQLAALESVANRVSEFDPSIPVYAQDPVFNTLDTCLLQSLNISVVTHPAAFTLITKNTLLFCPGAERKHLEQLLSFNPCMVFGGPLEDTESGVISKFTATVRSLTLTPFEPCEHALWKTRLYFHEREQDGRE